MRNAKLLALSLVVAIVPPVYGRTDVEAGLEQLQENAVNSKSNYEQYKDNMEISSGNVVETTKAIKELRDQRKQLTMNQSNIVKNKMALDKMKQKLAGHKAAEQERMKTEDAQITEVRAVLEKLEANKRQREMNLAAYEAKIQEIEKEKLEWDSQRKVAGELTKDLDTKEKEVLTEREKWIEKKKGYRSEAMKWYKQAQSAEQTQAKFKKLND